MPDRSPALDAAVRAVRGESDLAAVLPALTDEGLAHVIACAPETHHLVRVIAALCGGLTGLLDPITVADPALHAALRRVIGTPAGRFALSAWAEVAPAGWGRACAAALRDAVDRGRCQAWDAAALIGPGDESVGLLHTAVDVAFSIRWWGRAIPAAPTAWADALSAAERRRLLNTAPLNPFAYASCLPWLPLDAAPAAIVDDTILRIALDAFAAASPTARSLHPDLVRQIIADARPSHLAELTRLACAMQTDEVWTRVQMLIRESPDDAWRVVVAAPWDDLPEDVRDLILACADSSDVCAAGAAACGRRDAAATNKTEETAVAFFAALDPRVWDAIDAAAQRRWRRALWEEHAHVAVRSLGLRPDILARATLTDDLAHAVRRHARDAATQRAALLPVALRRLPPAAAYALIAAMPTLPRDSGAFFCVAGGRDAPDLIAPARAALRTPADLACAVALQRSMEIDSSIRDRSAVLQHALQGQTWDNLMSFMPLLSARVRADLMPNLGEVFDILAHPDRWGALRRALDRLAALPPAVAIPTRVALGRPWNSHDAAAALADALRAHGDVFLEILDALANASLRQALLPLPDDPSLARALRALAQDDPPTAQRLARALRDRSWRDAHAPLLKAQQPHANAVWSALDDDMRRGIASVLAAELLDANPLVARDPITALALAAVHSGDADLRAAGVAALTARPEMTRTIWARLPSAVQQSLGALPACADLSPPARPAIRRGRRVSRLS